MTGPQESLSADASLTDAASVPKRAVYWGLTGVIWLLLVGAMALARQLEMSFQIYRDVVGMFVGGAWRALREWNNDVLQLAIYLSSLLFALALVAGVLWLLAQSRLERWAVASTLVALTVGLSVFIVSIMGAYAAAMW